MGATYTALPQRTVSDVDEIFGALKYGSSGEKLEALTIVRGRMNGVLLRIACDKARVDLLVKRISSGNQFAPNDQEKIHSALWEILESGKDPLVCWYTAVALVDFGDVSRECLHRLVVSTQQVVPFLIAKMERGSPFALQALAQEETEKETIRALSKFETETGVSTILKECFEQRFLKGLKGDGELRRCALYALAAVGDPEFRPFVEYHAAKATDSREKNAARVALDLWGSADYDEISQHTRFVAENEKGFFGRLFGYF